MNYGPQTPEIEALISRLKTLTDEEINNLAADRDETYVAAGNIWDASRYAAWEVARNSAGPAAWYDARDPARDVYRYAAHGSARAARGSAKEAAWGAAWETIAALVVRDLISDDGFTQEQYHLLTGPWRRVIGPPHPYDMREVQP